MKYTLIIFGLVLYSSCISNDSPNNRVTKTDHIMAKSSVHGESFLKEAIITKGDSVAYNELSILYLDHDYQEEFLLYALIMANKYGYKQAYFDVFSCLTDLYINGIEKMDQKSASISIDYLIQASEHGHEQAANIVNKYSITRTSDPQKILKEIFSDK